MQRTDFEQWKGQEVARLLALVETERRYYQEMVATLPVAIAVLSSDRSIVLANRAFRQLFGVTGPEIRRRSIEQILPSDQLIERIRAAHTETPAEYASRSGLTVNAAGRTLRIEVRAIRGWDEEMELETLLAIQDCSGASAASPGTIPVAPFFVPVAPIVVEPVVVEPVVENVPEQNAAQHFEQRIEPLVAPQPAAAPVPEPPQAPPAFPSGDLPAVLWQAEVAPDNSTALRFTAVSGLAMRELHIAPAEWPQTENSFEQRIYAEDRAATMALYRTVIERGGEASAEFRMANTAGDLQWFRETIIAADPSASLASNETRKIYGVLTAIEERVRLHRQMEVAARHMALTNVSARLAHDLNNPLMLIAGYAEEMLQAFPEGDARRDDVQQIVKATERINEITSHLTRFTHRKASKAERVDVSAALQRLDTVFLGLCGDGAAVKLGASGPVWAMAEARPLEELLVTLADAAHDCAGCTELRVSCDSTTITEQIPNATLAPGTYARITIHANGTGLDAAKSISLFESILAKSADSARGESLTNAYTQAREWGGDLAYSGGATHSTFVLYLKPAEAPQPVAQPTSSVPSDTRPPIVIVGEPEAVLAPEPPKPLILVVDDEPGIRALVAKILRREQYEVIEASTAVEAGMLADTQARPLQLLVTDIMLPDHPGTRLAEQLTASIPTLKVLYMSGYTDDERARTGEMPPGAKFLQKPFTLSALVAKVRESLTEA